MADRDEVSQELRRQLEEIIAKLAKLSPDEAQKVRDRLKEQDDHFEQTMADVGMDFEATRQRVREIEAKALAKLKHPSRSRMLRSFVGDENGNP